MKCHEFFKFSQYVNLIGYRYVGVLMLHVKFIFLFMCIFVNVYTSMFFFY